MTSSTDEEYSGIVFSLSEDDSGEFSIARRRVLATSTSYTLRIETLSPSQAGSHQVNIHAKYKDDSISIFSDAGYITVSAQLTDPCGTATLS